MTYIDDEIVNIYYMEVCGCVWVYRLALSRSKQPIAVLPLFMCLLLDGNRLDTITNHNLTQ